MFTRAKLWRPVFALLCLILAVADLAQKIKVNPIDIALLALATVPWSLPWVANLLESLKVGGVDLKFRQQIEQKIAEHQKEVAAALSSGIGKPVEGNVAEVPGILSHSAKPAPDRGEASVDAGISHETDPDDPHKNQFGGKSVAGGMKLQADVKPFAGSTDLYVIKLSVTSTDSSKPLQEETPATFYLHPTFTPAVRQTRVKNGTASFDCVAWGAFTVGAEVDGVRLELDLAKEVPDAPLAFTLR